MQYSRFIHKHTKRQKMEISNTQPVKWRTKDGRELLPEDMSTPHINATLAMLKKGAEVADVKVMESMSCGYPQGEMAQMAFDSDMDRLSDEHGKALVSYNYWKETFQKELNKRNN